MCLGKHDLCAYRHNVAVRSPVDQRIGADQRVPKHQQDTSGLERHSAGASAGSLPQVLVNIHRTRCLIQYVFIDFAL